MYSYFVLTSAFNQFYSTFEPLWGVLRVATEKLANAHMQVVGRFQDLIKELKEYGDKQKERHKQVYIVQTCHFKDINFAISEYFECNCHGTFLIKMKTIFCTLE